MQEINSTVKSLPLHIEVYPTAVFYPEFMTLTTDLEIPTLLFYGRFVQEAARKSRAIGSNQQRS
jgi:hypothetical protein